MAAVCSELEGLAARLDLTALATVARGAAAASTAHPTPSRQEEGGVAERRRVAGPYAEPAARDVPRAHDDGPALRASASSATAAGGAGGVVAAAPRAVGRAIVNRAAVPALPAPAVTGPLPPPPPSTTTTTTSAAAGQDAKTVLPRAWPASACGPACVHTPPGDADSEVVVVVGVCVCVCVVVVVCGGVCVGGGGGGGGGGWLRAHATQPLGAYGWVACAGRPAASMGAAAAAWPPGPAPARAARAADAAAVPHRSDCGQGLPAQATLPPSLPSAHRAL
jgi:hypothetical protein